VTIATASRRSLTERLWTSDYGLHVLLISLLIAMFVAPALVAARMLYPVAIDLFFSLVVISGVMAVARRRVPVFTILFALLTVTARWAHLGLPTLALAVADGVFSGVMIATLAALILAQVFRAGPVTMHRIEGAVAVYLLVGVLWGSAYRVVWLLVPGAFTTTGGPVTDPTSLYYFSFVTLTTVGYGDIAPAVQASRGLAMMEALTGQLYPSILIARLVSLQIVASGYVRPESLGSNHDDHDAA
jgi:hypothetical protein